MGLLARISPSLGGFPRSRIPGFGEFSRKFSKNSNRSNLLKIGRSGNRKILSCTESIVFAKRDQENKIGWRNYNKIPYCGMWWKWMAIEVHCDDGRILSKGGGKAKIGICSFIREKLNKENKDKSNIRVSPIARASWGSIRVGKYSYEWGNTRCDSRLRYCSFPK